LFSFDQRVAEENAPEALEPRRNHEPCSGLQRDTLTFFVRDNGLGIAAEYQEKIFQFAGPRLRSREHWQCALCREQANYAIVVARRASAMIASFAGATIMVRVLLCGAMRDGVLVGMFARVTMPTGR